MTVERGDLKNTKSILGLSNQVNRDRLRIILNRPLDRDCLWAFMGKYKTYYGKPWIYNKTSYEYLNNLAGKEKGTEIFEFVNKDYGKFKGFVGDNSIKLMAVEDA